MLAKLEEKILQVNEATGIEIIILDNDDYYININRVINKRNVIEKKAELHGIKTVDAIKKNIEPGSPVSIVLNGKGVLIKKAASPLPADNLLQSVLPGSNADEFYYEILQGEHTNIISIARKTVVDKVINELKRNGYKIIAVRLGFSAIHNILPFISTNGEKQFETDSTLIDVKNSEIVDFRIKERVNNNKFHANEFLIGNQYVKPANLLSFSAAIGLMTDNLKEPAAIDSEILNHERKEYRYYRLFKVSLISFLSVLFVSLFVSFLFYSKYYNLNNQLKASNTIISGQNHSYTRLEREIKRKEKFLEQSGWTEVSKTSYYADRLAGLAPTEIFFTNMHIYPNRNSSISTASYLFKKDTILLNGVCGDPIELNTFINNIKLLPDFKEAVIKSYQYRSEKESGQFLMEIITR